MFTTKYAMQTYAWTNNHIRIKMNYIIKITKVKWLCKMQL